jgi:hypothetical protein
MGLMPAAYMPRILKASIYLLSYVDCIEEITITGDVKNTSLLSLTTFQAH